MLIGDITRLNAVHFKDKVAFEDEKRKLTFEQIDKRANALAFALFSIGIRKGDRIAVLLYNCSEYSELWFALPKAGFVIVPLNYRLVGRELAYIINNAEANTLIFGEEYTEMVEAIRPDIGLVRNFIVVGRKESDAREYEALIESSPASEISTPPDDADVACIMYTSGTTGRPKGVMLTHKNIIMTLYNYTFGFQPKESSVFLNFPPLYHSAASSTMFSYFFAGCTTITMKQFDVGLALATIADKKPNILLLPAAMQNMVTGHPDIGKYDLSFVDLIHYGGSSILVAQLKRSLEIFGCGFLQLGGQSEAVGGITCLKPEDHVMEGPAHVTRRLGSAGRELNLVQIKIVDPDGNEVPPDTPGEEIVRGDSVMKGYWKLPDATAETIVNGWLHTGDICVKDEGGYIYYVDRIKDMIVRGAENVYSREVEEVIATHPAVMEVAVVGVPDERMQEEIMAVVALKPGMSLTDREIVVLCEKNLARYKKPRYVEFVESLPKNAGGKILKRELRDRYKDISLTRGPIR